MILLLLAALASLPPLGVGYANLWAAATASSPADASRAYETAARFLFWRSDLYESAGLQAADDPARAVQLLKTAQQQGSLSPAGQLALARAELALKQPAQALELLQNLLSSGQQVPEAAALVAQIYREGGQQAQETSTLREWLRAEPDNPAANERLGLILAANAAPEALDLLLTAGANSADEQSRLAGIVAALQTPGEDAYRLARCGQALGQLDEWNLAEAAFQRAVQANQAYAEAWAWLGLARLHNGSGGSREAVQTALQLNPNSALVHGLLGTYAIQTGNPAEAVSQYSAATRLEPGNPAWWAALGSANAQIDLPAALSDYSHATDLAPDEAVYWYELASFCVERNAFIQDYGLNAALRAFALQPKNPLYIDMLGQTQSAVGLTDPAQAMYQRALGADGPPAQQAMIHLHLGLLYLQTGRNTEAKFELQQAVSLDPQGPYGGQAQKLLARYFP